MSKRILSVQDISCVGQCSLTVALPIISACGIETSILPSAVLSTHTGGFSGYTFRDLTEDMPHIVKHWQKEGLDFDAFYTGYLGSLQQIDLVKELFGKVGKPQAVKIVDPAMGDNGRLYAGFDEEFARKMATLCTAGDYILPNITEACFMTGAPYRESYDENYVDSLLKALGSFTDATVIMTGIGYTPEETGVLVWNGKEKQYYRHRRIPGGFHGTGDVYASAFTGVLLSGRSCFDAARIAADFTLSAIQNTVGDHNHRYGVKFEEKLPDLILSMRK